MSHLSRLCASLAMATMGVAMLAAPSMSSAQTPPAPTLVPAGFLQGAGYNLESDNVRDLGNWNDCMKYEISAGMHYCPGFFFFIPTPPYPAPCVDFDYREPQAVVEVTCTGKSTLKGATNLTSVFAGSNQRAGQPDCVANIKTENGSYSRAFNHAIVRTPAGPISRLSMAASPIQVAQSYTCGIMGVAGNMDMLQNLQNFSLAEVLDPSAWQGSITDAVTGVQDSLQNLNLDSMFSNLGSIANGDFLTNMFTGLQDMVTGFFTNLQQMFVQLETTLQGLMTGNLPLANINMGDLTTMGQGFLDMGNALGGAAAVSGAGDMLNQAIAATTAGNALLQIANPGQTAGGAGQLASVVQSALGMGFQGQGGTQTAQKDTFYATNFTPESFADMADTTTGRSKGWGSDRAEQMSQYSAENPPPKDGIPVNLPNDSYASWSFISKVVRGPDGKMKPVGFIEDGATQALLKTMVDNISETVARVNSAANLITGPMLSDLQSYPPARLCSTQKQIGSALETLNDFKVAMGLDTSPTRFFPNGSYLNSTQFQNVARNSASASCPLTNAGFVAKVDDPAKLEIRNCTSVCHTESDGDDEDKTVCVIVPKAGYGGSCYSNALSTQMQDGLYPACNGYKPARVADGKGGWHNVGEQYNASTDHLKRLNDKYRTQLLQTAAAGTARLTQAKQQVDNLLRTQGGACTALGNPTGPEEWLARTPMPSKSQTADLVGDSMNILANSPAQPGLQAALNSFTVDNELLNMTGSLEQLTALQNAGVEGLVVGQAGMVDPGVLPVVFDSGGGGFNANGYFVDEAVVNTDGHHTFEWLMANPLTRRHWVAPNSPLSGMNNNVVQGSFQILSGETAGVAELAGCGSKLLADMMPGGAMAGVGGTFCWGNVHDGTGWSEAKIGPIQQLKAGLTAVNESVDEGTIVKDTSPPEEVKVYDRANLNQTSEAQQAMVPTAAAPTGTPGAANSKCYAQGSLNPAQYTPGEMAIPIQGMMDSIVSGLDLRGMRTNADDGVVTLTFWKNTKCCIPPTCPQNIRQDW